jgi:hypothetical protein
VRNPRSIWGGIRGLAGGVARSGIGRGIGRMARGGGLAAVAGLGFDLLPDFKGKDTISSALSMGGLGAQIGSMILPGVGTAIGGGLGAAAGVAIANWEPIKNGIAAGFGKLQEWSGSVGNFIKNDMKWTPIGAAFNLFDTIKENGIMGTLEIFKNNIGDFFDTALGAFGKFGDWIASKFEWAKNWDVTKLLRSSQSYGNLLYNDAISTGIRNDGERNFDSCFNIQFII